ncbi:putative capsule biosynthesis protein HipA [Desulforapulum autotrophicum HRM2]|uniref:Capsule biosynthesis protein HipA n=1 Tax=Desulforapulum autotrophicum (strain ATCC 43914 / DSM 3382 / VKM B-1955 / HRM2) TaxID=177437 RepID=C0QGW3_DESAH|nr:type II toxin-antitoxin system HipA family toxin [Desulforapulum autotrophicum]ACN15612.1 putative capsule biosynthesis protein HipA [Desulforapulum autotrophicum HRM2]
MKVLNVYLKKSSSDKILVGKIAENQKTLYFQYDPQFLLKSIQLSPYKLPLQSDAFEHKDREFSPVFGLFDDSLPDGWGLLLMDRYLQRKGIIIDSFSVLDRLSFLGHSTMGALVYEPSMAHDSFDQLVDLQTMAEHSREIIKSESVEIIPELMRMGGSPQGARPKIVVGLKGDQLISGADDLPEGYEHWLIKFPSPKDTKDSGRVEMAYSLMARSAGIQMPTTRLFEVESGDAFFGIKRFDRKGNRRFHVHSLGGVLHSNFRIPECDYSIFLRVVSDLTKNQTEVERGFRQMVFNIMSHNRDDHVKNFAFMLNANNEWTLTPAYDLIYSGGPGGEHTMSVQGEGRNPGLEQVKQIGTGIGFKDFKVRNIIEEVAEAIQSWERFAGTTGVSKKSMTLIQKKLSENIQCFCSRPTHGPSPF